eukprot:SAG25_NODE_487_length_7465_cov_4.695900_5_plen_150_part_00
MRSVNGEMLHVGAQGSRPSDGRLQLYMNTYMFDCTCRISRQFEQCSAQPASRAACSAACTSSRPAVAEAWAFACLGQGPRLSSSGPGLQSHRLPRRYCDSFDTDRRGDAWDTRPSCRGRRPARRGGAAAAPPSRVDGLVVLPLPSARRC